MILTTGERFVDLCFATCLHSGPSVNSAGEDSQAVIARLRARELHLIQDRDRLIADLCEAEKRLAAITALLTN